MTGCSKRLTTLLDHAAFFALHNQGSVLPAALVSAQLYVLSYLRQPSLVAPHPSSGPALDSRRHRFKSPLASFRRFLFLMPLVSTPI